VDNETINKEGLMLNIKWAKKWWNRDGKKKEKRQNGKDVDDQGKNEEEKVKKKYKKPREGPWNSRG
jgi:hypothetical protein